jgi:hypothetical protein
LSKTYIIWPKDENMKYVHETIANRTDGDFKNCSRFIDGSTIDLRHKPLVDGEAYFTRKKTYAINAQGVCDWNRRFIFLSVGQCGSVHNSRAYKETSLYKKSSQFFQTPNEYLLGDKGYALSNRVIIPYKEPLRAYPQRRRFNKHLSAARVKIEHCFGILKSRFPSLKSLPIYIRHAKDHKKACEWIVACCILHNMILTIDGKDDWFEEGIVEEDEDEEDSEDDERNNNRQDDTSSQAGKILREKLSAHIRLLDRERLEG